MKQILMRHNHQYCKDLLKSLAKEMKARHPNDKPKQREALNDLCDRLIKDIPASISDKKREYYAKILSSYTASLHPGD